MPNDAPQGQVLHTAQPASRADELRSFIFLTAIMTPILAVIVVAGYGFVVWIYQVFAGPPTA